MTADEPGVRALRAWLDAYARTRDLDLATRAAAEAAAGDPWTVVEVAGLLARCVPRRVEEDTGLTRDLRVRAPGGHGVVAVVPEGAWIPEPRNPIRRGRGAFDTPRDMARALVATTLAAIDGRRSVGQDPMCGSGAFLLAMSEQGVGEILGFDLDSRVLQVARVAVPGACLEVGDALDEGPRSDLVLTNPPFVSAERQGEAVRRASRRRHPWLKGRFDLVVPLAASAVQRVREGGGAGLVLPSPLLVQPYGVGLRRRWLERHAVIALGGPTRFPTASVDVVQLVLRTGSGPAPVGDSGIAARTILELDACPIDPSVRQGDFGLLAKVRARSVPLGDLCLVDTGVVSHRPGGSRETLLFDEPGEGRVPYADARQFFAGERRWLSYRPECMHRAKSPLHFEPSKIVVQRVRGRGSVKAAIDRDGVYVGHTCSVVCPRRADAPSLEKLLEVVRSPVTHGVLRIERGLRTDLYPRDLAALPVPTGWLGGQDDDLGRSLGLSEEEALRLAALAPWGGVLAEHSDKRSSLVDSSDSSLTSEGIEGI